MNRINRLFEVLAAKCTAFAGSSTAFALALLMIVAWLITGPIFHFSAVWQLVINTGTTIVTFLMVFLIQRAQNKDILSIHVKLNELISAQEGASNRLINIESATEEEILEVKRNFERLTEEICTTLPEEVCQNIIEAADDDEAA
ncbi:MAG TPA: low affinity iron permease family protein [Planktothrix sp.]|jgi:low affinity Fe/Cu permease